MKITYDLRNNFFKATNLFLGIEQQKNQLIKNPNKKILKSTTHILIAVVYTIISFILFGIAVYTKQKSLENLFYFIFSFLILYTLYYIIILITTYFRYKKFAIGILKISKDGIEDEYDNGTKILIPWDKIELIVIKNNSLIIFTKVANCVINAAIKENEITEFISTCNKYKNDIFIINKMEK